ncbi:unnamed protein product, partial [Ectocarpus sp. 6 AP-2014]
VVNAAREATCRAAVARLSSATPPLSVPSRYSSSRKRRAGVAHAIPGLASRSLRNPDAASGASTSAGVNSIAASFLAERARTSRSSMVHKFTMSSHVRLTMCAPPAQRTLSTYDATAAGWACAEHCSTLKAAVLFGHGCAL